MRIEKQQLIEQFIAAGDLERAERADRELPDHIDPAEHEAVLADLGLNAGLLMTQSDNLEDQYPDQA
ncbi:MAG TPA: hypothetical protein VM307_13025 [Egibacteraceae bacterium]|nr:hypothetical protein [Egibacteraceae bacterium]